MRGAEIGLGAGLGVFQAGRDAAPGGQSVSVGSVSVNPRVVLPLSPTVGVPVGVRVTQEFGARGTPGTFVGLSFGLRRIWADDARMVLK